MSREEKSKNQSSSNVRLMNKTNDRLFSIDNWFGWLILLIIMFIAIGILVYVNVYLYPHFPCGIDNCCNCTVINP